MTKESMGDQIKSLQQQLDESLERQRRTQQQVEYLGEVARINIEQRHALRVAHGDCNASTGFTQMKQEIDGVNAGLTAIVNQDQQG